MGPTTICRSARKREEKQLTTSLVTIENKVPLADSREIAEQLGIEHESFFKMVKQYEEEVSKDFGQVRFEIGLGTPGRGGKAPKWALLTEDQSYVYLAYSQNTEQARGCKRLLVKAFAEARAELTQAAPALPESAFSYRYELRLVVSNPEQMQRAKAIMAQAEQLAQSINGPTTTQRRLEVDILKYVKDLSERFQPPTARDLSRYILYVSKEEIELEANVLVTCGLLTKDQSGKSPRYSLR
jgi:phage regulator Rha-like protein